VNFATEIIVSSLIAYVKNTIASRYSSLLLHAGGFKKSTWHMGVGWPVPESEIV